ncbi:MAG TPA: flagellar export chaperone FliS [Bryobacteraceae bacterium]|nr:flagellar export chaperone FliS [Bryobacteraceae bacterium]
MNAYETYRESEILSADPVRLIELLYHGAVDAVREARMFLRAGDIEARGRAVSRASAILLELAASLDSERGGDLSRNLAELYVYMHGRLSTAHLTQTEDPLAEVEKLLVTLLEGWNTLQCADPEVPAELNATAEAHAERFSCTF